MISLDKLTIFETHIDELHETELRARIQVHASCIVSDEAVRVHGSIAKATARDDIERSIWEQIYGGKLRDQANRINQAFILVEPSVRYENRKDADDLRAEIRRLFELINYKQ